MRRVFGHIPGVPVGTWFPDRLSLARAGVHRPTQAGISGSARDGCDSIVVSGGYVDDHDLGDVLIYTGHGGRDPESGCQIADQELDRQNKALAVSCIERLPVRVVRGAKGDPHHSPPSGYRYDGLFLVERYRWSTGRDGFRVLLFDLLRIPDDAVELPEATEAGTPSRRRAVVTRIVRDASLAQRVKRMYDDHCQICDLTLPILGGAYSEAAHIKPLGSPHHGPDRLSNLLCLCPNHHAMLDRGGLTINDDLSLNGYGGSLTRAKRHSIGIDFIRYHRALFS